VDALGAKVIVALGTKGSITDANFDAMMAIPEGRLTRDFVNVHVDRPWQDGNHAVITSGVARHPNAVMAVWATLAAPNPQWFGGDGTHIGIDGLGATALTALVTTTMSHGCTKDVQPRPF
jgi:hypothetical protein